MRSQAVPKHVCSLQRIPVLALHSDQFRQQPVVFFFDDRVSLAGAQFETRPVDHHDVAPCVAYEPRCQ